MKYNLVYAQEARSFLVALSKRQLEILGPLFERLRNFPHAMAIAKARTEPGNPTFEVVLHGHRVTYSIDKWAAEVRILKVERIKSRVRRRT